MMDRRTEEEHRERGPTGDVLASVLCGEQITSFVLWVLVARNQWLFLSIILKIILSYIINKIMQYHLI